MDLGLAILIASMLPIFIGAVICIVGVMFFTMQPDDKTELVYDGYAYE